ncbi:MAG: putative ABC transporter permease [Oscillospiraceae bacterium]|nr:putative ABC transporter permease [Oscillospiraceae bacterium]
MMGLELLTALAVGGAIYGVIEMLWRGHTHWSMILTGGVCFAFMYLVAVQPNLARPIRYVWCAVLVTAVEFVSGGVFNRLLGWHIWDYSHMRLNLYGQVCLRYSLYWFLLSVPGCALARLIRSSFFLSG